MTTADRERFQSDAQAYAAYLETPEGRLRLDLAFANLQEFLPRFKNPVILNELGCGGIRRRLRRVPLKSDQPRK